MLRWEDHLVQIGMLGPFEVRGGDGVALDVPGARLRALLIALALEPGRVVSKAALVDWIWGEHPPGEAANALHRLVSRLRKALPEGAVEGHAAGYRLVVDPDAVDAVRFEHLVGRARSGDTAERTGLLREALALWRGPAMQDVDLPDSAAFVAASVRLEELRLTAVEDRFDAASISPDVGVISELTALVAAHPVRERLVAALMRALAAAGRDTEALVVYQRTREALADALGVDPGPELSALHGALLRGEMSRPVENRKTNVRAELTSFVGRDADVAMVRDILVEHRLATLVGPGGAGKTRLAAEVARTLLDATPDGVWLVELAAIGSDGDVPQATLAALGLRDAPLGDTSNADVTDRLVAAIRDREALLILDNCEHVIDAAAVFADRVLGQCRRLRILATSREPLGITGEALWPVEPLALPETAAGPDAMASSPAVQLLRDRAGAVRKDLVVDAHTLATMVRVCRALDGMPLAIELAAAGLRTMSLEQLANRLDDRFRLLTSGSRTALPRHKTLRAVVDWSWELLSDAERKVLRRLSVFSGGVSLEAAERVCAGDGVHDHNVFAVLTSLTEKSLVQLTEGDGELRYRMLGTIMEYAAHRLADAGETDLARHAHLACFTELAETAEPYLRRAEQLEWLTTLRREHDNIGAAMRGAVAAGEAQGAMRLAAAAGQYWWFSGRKVEGAELLTAATKVPGEVTDDVRAVVYTLIANFVSSGRGDELQAAEWIHEAYRFAQRSRLRHPLMGFIEPLERMLQSPDAFLPAFESLLGDDDPWVRAMARLQLGKGRVGLGDGGTDADGYLVMAVAEFRAIGERFGISFALSELADRIAMRGDLAGACEHYEQAIVVITELGAIEDVIRMRTRQAQLYWLMGEKSSSTGALAEAERCAERVTWPSALAELAFTKADLARWRGDTEVARRQLIAATAVLGTDAEQPDIRATTHDLLGYLTDDLDASRTHRLAAFRAATEAGHPSMIAQVLVGIADQALREQRFEQATRLLAASAGVRGLPDLSRPDEARIEQDARRHLGDARFTEVFREGTLTSWTELVAATLGP